tara:strand:+ start:206 stop:943 length:738 start_codon:yes stop_codon:yes gene_type:complete
MANNLEYRGPKKYLKEPVNISNQYLKEPVNISEKNRGIVELLNKLAGVEPKNWWGYSEDQYDPTFINQMLEESRTPSWLTGDIYNLEGRINQANIPTSYSLRDMDAPYPSDSRFIHNLNMDNFGSATDNVINILDLLQQQKIIADAINQTTAGSNLFNIPRGHPKVKAEPQSVESDDLDNVLRQIAKMDAMVDAASNWPDEDMQRELNEMKVDYLQKHKQYPIEFPLEEADSTKFEEIMKSIRSN